MATWRQALTRAIDAEVAAEKAASSAEQEKRRTWWDTTWELAAVPRAEAGKAYDLYAQKTGGAKATAERRRRVGTRFPNVETGDAAGLPMPSLVMEASDALGKDLNLTEALAKIREAETAGMSMREFRVLLGGKPYHAGTLTEDEEDAVVEKVARHRPKAVAQHAAKPRVAAEIVDDKQSNKSVIQQQSRRTQRLVNKRRQAVAAAGADVKGEVNDAVTAGLSAMDNTPGYNRVCRSQGEMISTWIGATKEQSFNDLDLHMLVADQPALERHVNERRVVAEARAEGSDPWMALEEHRREVNEDLQRQMDEAESGTTLDDVDEIEKFANEGA